EITMAAVVPASAMAGVPATRPVFGWSDAQVGRPVALKVRASPSGSTALAWNCQGMPAVAVRTGMPEIAGARFGDSSAGAGVWASDSADSGTHPATATLAMTAASPTRQFRIAMHSLPQERKAGGHRLVGESG